MTGLAGASFQHLYSQHAPTGTFSPYSPPPQALLQEAQSWASNLLAEANMQDFTMGGEADVAMTEMLETNIAAPHHHAAATSPREDGAARRPELFLQPVTRQQYGAPPAETAPCPRFGHTAVVHEDEMLVFGGRDARCLGDLWAFNFLTKAWRQIDNTKSPTCPCPRAGHTASMYDGKMYIFGGVGARDNWLNDMWALDVATQTWSQVVYAEATEEEMPQGRKGHTAVVSRKSMFIFGGGQDDTTLHNDLWEYKFDEERWVRRVMTGVVPTARMYHVAVLVPSDKMLLFGGRALTGTGFLNDVIEVHLAPGVANCAVVEHTPSGPAPSSRMCSTAIYHNHTVAIFTGGSFSYLDDSYQLDLRKMQWSPINDVTFGGRTRPTTVKWRNTIMTFGGCVHVNGYVNDFVEVELEPMTLLQTMREYVLEKGIDCEGMLPPNLKDYLES